ncbi:MAG: hypothetical protein IPP32_09055 [Bacteroidetes bacterium]|nr:hypothetical protein [Bacteroidota bacterium]
MDIKATPIEVLFEKAEDYSKTTLELYKLNLIDKTADVVSSLISRLAILMVVALIVFIASIGLSFWIGEYMPKPYYGFFVLGGFYTLCAILMHSFKQQWIKYPISNSIIKQLLKEKE